MIICKTFQTILYVYCQVLKCRENQIFLRVLENTYMYVCENSMVLNLFWYMSLNFFCCLFLWTLKVVIWTLKISFTDIPEGRGNFAEFVSAQGPRFFFFWKRRIFFSILYTDVSKHTKRILIVILLISHLGGHNVNVKEI